MEEKRGEITPPPPPTLGALLSPLLQHPQYKLHIGGKQSANEKEISSVCVCVCVCVGVGVSTVCVNKKAEWEREHVCVCVCVSGCNDSLSSLSPSSR